MNYQEFSDKVKICTNCSLCKTRTNVVVGEGSVPAKVMIVGEAPGKTEDLTGRPFVGLSGKLLRKELKNAGFKPEDTYITNIVKCRPPENRDPEKIEIETCRKYLDFQITNLIKPDYVVGIGRISSQILIPGYYQKRDHGKIFDMSTYKFMGTYHPAAGMRNGEYKEKMIQDLKFLSELIYGKSKPKEPKTKFWE